MAARKPNAVSDPVRKSRRPRRTRGVSAERLEDRLVLDGSLAPPALYASLDELRQGLVEAAVSQWKSVLGQKANFPIYATPVAMAPVPGAISMAAAGGVSQTNDQVAGVDEADSVKTDGHYLYILSHGELDIVDAHDPKNLTVVSRTTFSDSYPTAEFLDGTRLTVIASAGSGGPIMRPMVEGVAAAVMLPVDGGPNWSWTPKTKVTEYDVSNPTSPQVVRDTTLDGSYVGSRAIGDQVYVVVEDSLGWLPSPQFKPVSDLNGGPEQWVYESETDYRAALEKFVSGVNLPQFSSTVPGATGPQTASGALEPATAIYKPALPSDQTLTSIAVFDAKTTTPGPAGSTGAMTPVTSIVYASNDHIDLFGTEWPNFVGGPIVYQPAIAPTNSTVIHQFSVQGDSVGLNAVGQVDGQVLNQYSVDEQGPDLRVATTTTTWFVPGAATVAPAPPNAQSNALVVLTAQNGLLTKVGSLDNLAPGERIYSVRFMGDRAFVVTYEQVDPLFAVDLSDPTTPKVAGSLEMPGFSRFLQPIDATHLIGIGRSVNPDTQRTTGLQLSLFDVSDLANPKRVAVQAIAPPGWSWTNSDAEFDPHALSYFADAGVLAFPISGFTASADGSYPWHSQLEVFKVDSSLGFTALGAVDHDSAVHRSVEIGSTLFSIAENDVKAVSKSDPSMVLGSAVLFVPDPGQGGGPGEGGPIVVPPIPAGPPTIIGSGANPGPGDGGPTGGGTGSPGGGPVDPSKPAHGGPPVVAPSMPIKGANGTTVATVKAPDIGAVLQLFQPSHRKNRLRPGTHKASKTRAPLVHSTTTAIQSGQAHPQSRAARTLSVTTSHRHA
jgi:uncharacterized secreted protein with C-terminal beta-propeller domain